MPYKNHSDTLTCVRRWKSEHPQALKAQKLRYGQRHKKELAESHREYHRNHRISTYIDIPHHGATKIYPAPNKRPYPIDNLCELCDTEKPLFLKYHHWDDADFGKGIWVCQACHRTIHCS